MRSLVVSLLALLLSACATSPAPPVVESNGKIINTCAYDVGGYTSDGTYIESDYNCPKASPSASYAPNNCKVVDGYRRSDGTYVDSHLRCKSNLSPTSSSSTGSGSSSSDAPCVNNYCGPVNVKGYYRKDGTYVRPHTRSSRR